MRILIVDDHQMVRHGVRTLLQAQQGFEVCGEAADGLEAIRQAEQLKPDAIVMDISMPNLNGLEATREIARVFPRVYVVILSQHESAGMMREALKAGARGYVVKSAISKELVPSLKTIHERTQAEDSLRRSQESLAREVADLTLLQGISTELVHSQDVRTLHEKIIDAAAGIMRSDYASMQLLDAPAHELVLLAFRGFNPEAAQFWQRVPADSGSTCAVALRTLKRVIASDIEECDFMAGTEDLATYRHTGIRAVQSTPLLSRSGRLVGMISTHWSRVHMPSERDLRVFDVLARQAADILERRLSEEALRESEQRLRVLARQLESEVLARTAELQQRNQELQLLSEELRELSNRLLQAQEEERRHIARELHDSVGQHLAGLSMLLGSRSGLGDDRIKEAAGLIKTCTAEIRTISHLLHPPLLEEVGLSSAIRWYVEGFSTRSGIAADIQIPEQLVRLEKNTELALFRVLQESLTNVHRHSGSKTVAIRVGVDSRHVWLQVEDKGKRNRSAGTRGGIGITGMRERVKNLAGEFSMSSNPHGTRIKAVLPLLPTRRASRPRRLQSKRFKDAVGIYDWHELVLDAFTEREPRQRARKVNAAERAISARLCHPQAPDLKEHMALREALQALRSLFPHAQPAAEAAGEEQSA